MPIAAATTDELTRRVRAAHADAWELEGRAREPYGGGAARVRGARLMASGIAETKWNNADVIDASVDVDAIRSWYAARDTPWGMRIPLELDLDVGEPLFVKRCVALRSPRSPRRGGASLEVRREQVAAEFASAEARAFRYDADDALTWVAPQFGHPGFRHWVARVDGETAAIGTTVRTDGDAGPAAYLTGLALVAGAPIDALTLVVDHAAADAFASGAVFVHANPTGPEQDEALTGHDPVEVPGFLIRTGG